MKKIVFVRHGESVANAGGVTMEHAKIPLSTLGRRQAALLAPRLNKNPEAVLVSAFQRARETAAPYCEIVGRSPSIHNLLHELSAIDPALIQGMTGAERRPIADSYWQSADPHLRMGQEAETFEEFASRVTEFRRDHLPTLLDGTILFGHGIWLGLLCWQLMRFDTEGSQGMRAFRRFQSGLPMPNCAVYEFTQHTGSEWQIKFDSQTYRHIVQI